jgi:hypothetical protein
MCALAKIWADAFEPPLEFPTRNGLAVSHRGGKPEIILMVLPKFRNQINSKAKTTNPKYNRPTEI